MPQGCMRASEEVKESLDVSADPCNDFYTFACGGFNSKAVIPDDKTVYSQFEVIEEKMEVQVRINSQNSHRIYVRGLYYFQFQYFYKT